MHQTIRDFVESIETLPVISSRSFLENAHIVCLALATILLVAGSSAATYDPVAAQLLDVDAGVQAPVAERQARQFGGGFGGRPGGGFGGPGGGFGGRPGGGFGGPGGGFGGQGGFGGGGFGGRPGGGFGGPGGGFGGPGGFPG
ncbi:glycine-rich RNA-binding protein 2 [Drosophila mauritiana]|uniref:Glycine-rich RNA-binding protein 2 n=1 Tax=Drosophila mauritiana TaxID=7226 RepID=A0A6P8KUP0_DROMA|nr:glycine-rich RNA-binding protein 2 [Drosophila mauritiana]